MLDGGKGSHAEFGMALAWDKKVYLYSENSSLDTPFYHLSEVNVIEGSIERFIEQVLEGARV